MPIILNKRPRNTGLFLFQIIKKIKTTLKKSTINNDIKKFYLLERLFYLSYNLNNTEHSKLDVSCPLLGLSNSKLEVCLTEYLKSNIATFTS